MIKHVVRAALSLAAVLTAGSSIADPAVPPADTQPAVWVSREILFSYSGITTHYSCETLRDKIKALVLVLGARRSGLHADEASCAQPRLFAGVQLRMATLQPAGQAAAAPPSSPVVAHWKAVDTDQFPGLLDVPDCELAVQVKRQILPAFATRNVQELQDPVCPPGRLPTRRPALRLEVLVPVDGA
ncbi:MAG: hypothetical protein P4L83_18935 [Nevskia sp.]|nr:hypothetical protein [Nevskia sp.]